MANTTAPARCRRTAFDELECTIPFNRELIDRWKSAVPYARRSYDPASKAWRFWGGYEAEAIEQLLAYFPDAEIPTRRRSGSGPKADRCTDHFRVLHLRETAPVELIEASYRVLARLHHPDHGGATETMQQINGAYAALRERVSA
jgi:hypothetical protein